MASSGATVENARENAARVAWVDNLRVAAISGVIVVHTATAYVTDFADWYYDDELQPTTVGFAVFALPALLGGIFGLGPLFWLAGWFSVPALRRRGPARFAVTRLVRLGVPLLVFVLLVNPLADLVGNMRREDRPFLAYLAETEFSVMWFVAALMFCSLAYAALGSPVRAIGRNRRPGTVAALVAGVVIGILCLLVWPLSSLLDEHLMSLRPGAWIQGVVLFLLGVLTGEAASSDGPVAVDAAVEQTGRRWGWVSLGGLATVVVLIGWADGEGALDDALGGRSWQGVVFTLVYGVVSVSFTLWCLGWFHRRCNGDRAWSRRAGRASYACYLFHPLVLTSLMVALWWVPGGAAVKFLLVAALGVPLCFAVGDALTRLPGLRRVL